MGNRALGTLGRVCWALLLVVALTGVRGCGGTTGKSAPKKKLTSVDISCDTFVNGRSSCEDQPGKADPAAAGCPVRDGFCGVCSSSGKCIYCPSGTLCPADPCSKVCAPEETRKICPDGYPVDCGSFCCPSGFRACCFEDGKCAASYAECSDTESGGNNGGFQCNASNPQVYCEVVAPCSKCTVSSCGGPDGSGCGFYRTSDGQTFSCNMGLGDGCQSVANQALRHCGCIQ